MRCTNRFNIAAAFCMAIVVINTAATSRADRCLHRDLAVRQGADELLAALHSADRLCAVDASGLRLRDRCELCPGLPDLRRPATSYFALPIGWWPP